MERQSYSLVKLFEEQILLNSHSQGDIDVSIARIFGCFSERSNKKWSGGHVPLFIDRALKGKDIIIHGDGKQTRCMSYVSDIVDGLVSMMDNFDVCRGDIINIGTDEEMTVLEHAQLIKKITDSESNIIFINEEEAHGKYKDIRRRKPNLEKVKNLIDYVPKTSFEESLKKVIRR